MKNSREYRTYGEHDGEVDLRQNCSHRHHAGLRLDSRRVRGKESWQKIAIQYNQPNKLVITGSAEKPVVSEVIVTKLLRYVLATFFKYRN